MAKIFIKSNFDNSMKNFLIIVLFAFLNTFTLLSQNIVKDFPNPFPEVKKGQIKIYLCSRLTKEARQFNDQLMKYLDDRIVVFRPQDVDWSSYPDELLDEVYYRKDISAMENADLLFMIIPYGRDCAWECGWAKGAKLLTIAYVESDLNWYRDAMVKGGLDYIITPSKEVWEVFSKSPTIIDKCFLISSKEELSDLICKLHNQKKALLSGGF
jgi:nucleoside 2-deoxyribosyltransferase